jgi:hypothetical protein
MSSTTVQPDVLFSDDARRTLCPHRSARGDQARLEAAARDVRQALARMPSVQTLDFELHGQALRATALQPGEYLVETLAEIWAEYEPPADDVNWGEQPEDF